MSASQVSQRYAKGWLSAAKDPSAKGGQSLDSVAGDTNALLGMIANSPEFHAFLNSPLISQPDQSKVMDKIASQAKLGDTTTSMIRLLITNRRLPALEGIVKAAKAMIDAASGVTSAQVTSATPLDEKKIADIRTVLSKKLGEDVAIETKIDPTIIGGMVVRIGSTMIDDSVKTKLDRMARRLQGQAA
jgi:F-type H+-transporting ATPase subunit delta